MKEHAMSFFIGFFIGALFWSVTTDIARHEMIIDLSEQNRIDEEIIKVTRMQQDRIENIENHLIYLSDSFGDSLDKEIQLLIQ